MNKDWDTAAKLEGWAIFNCDGQYQICKIDDPEALQEELGVVPPMLLTDAFAWRIVMEGTGEHHIFARNFIQKNNPKEWEEMQRYVDFL